MERGKIGGNPIPWARHWSAQEAGASGDHTQDKKEKSRLPTPIWLADIRMASAHTAHHPTSTPCLKYQDIHLRKHGEKCLIYCRKRHFQGQGTEVEVVRKNHQTQKIHGDRGCWKPLRSSKQQCGTSRYPRAVARPLYRSPGDFRTELNFSSTSYLLSSPL